MPFGASPPVVLAVVFEAESVPALVPSVLEVPPPLVLVVRLALLVVLVVAVELFVAVLATVAVSLLLLPLTLVLADAVEVDDDGEPDGSLFDPLSQAIENRLKVRSAGVRRSEGMRPALHRSTTETSGPLGWRSPLGWHY